MSRLVKNKRKTAVLVLFVLALSATLFIARVEFEEEAADFSSFYYGAKLTFEGRQTPYNNSNWRLIRPEYTEGELFPFLYPPPILLVFRLFTFFDFQIAKLIMLGLNHFLILVFLYLFLGKILGGKLDNPSLAAGIMYLYWFYPLRAALEVGQVGIWVLISICRVVGH